MVTIGLDPHPDSHTVAALDENGTTLASLTVPNTSEGLVQLHQFACSFPKRRWAVKGAANRFILPFVCVLLEQGKKQREAEELARLMYVGLTRARDRLLLSTSDTKGPAHKLLTPGIEAIDVSFTEVAYDAAMAVYPTTAVPVRTSEADKLKLITE